MRSQLCVILIADLTGYTEYISSAGRRDVDALVSQQKRTLQPLVEQRAGRVVKWMGDAVLATFGSATEAILCGQAMHEVSSSGTERGQGALATSLKVVAHAGDVQVADDGDIYGDAVNLTARLEKLATSDDVYFSDPVRQVMTRTEIPHEPYGSFELKGIAEPVDVYRTCFGKTPVSLQKAALLQTNFTHIHSIADEMGWSFLHPLLDTLTEAIIETARAHSGTNRGVMQNGCFLTFVSVENALASASEMRVKCREIIERSGLDRERLKVRSAIHLGELSILKYTMMGRDIDIVRTLSALGTGDEILLSETAKARLASDNASLRLSGRSNDQLRDCRSKVTWMSKFHQIGVFAATSDGN